MINDLLATFNPSTPPTGNAAKFTSGNTNLIPNKVGVGTTLNGGVDLELENITLEFSGLAYVAGNWTGQVAITAEQGVLFAGLLDVAVADDGTDTSQGQDADLFGIAGEINLAVGNSTSHLDLDDLDAKALGWPSFIAISLNELSLKFSDFRGNDNLNSLHLDVTFTGFDTGIDWVNDLITADNPLYGLTVTGSASGTLAIKNIEDTVSAGGNLDFKGAFTSALAAATGSELDGLAGFVSGKLFKVGDFSAGFIYHKITVDPDGGGPLAEKSAGYLAIEGSFSIGDEKLGGRSTKFVIAFAVSELGPLQIYISGGPIKRFEPTTGLTIEEAHLGVRFNTNIEELQTGTDFTTSGALVLPAPGGAGFRVTMTMVGHDLVAGNRFRIKDAVNGNYNGSFEVLSVNGDDVTYEVATDPGVFVGSANIIRLTITNPLDLRDEGLASGIAPPDDILVWRAQLDLAVTNQILAGDNLWAQIVGDVVIGGGATLSIDPIPDTVLQLKVDLLIDSNGRILLTGILSLADGFVEIPAKLYADLSDLFNGNGRFLFLADIPQAPVIDPLLVLRGSISFETLVGNHVTNVSVAKNADNIHWDITMTLPIDNPSTEYEVGDKAVIFGWQTASVNGTYLVTAVDDAANTITVQSATDPGVLVIGSGGSVVNEAAAKGGFRIILEGGVDLNIPEVTTITLEGDARIEFKLPGAGPAELTMDLAFNVTLSETHVGNIGAAVGKFHVTIDTDVAVDSAHPVGGVEIWGAAILTTDFDFLKKIGLFASAEGLLRINSSDTAKPDEVLQNTAGTDVVIGLPARSFALRLDGSVDLRIDYNRDAVFGAEESVGLLAGTFVLEFSAAGGFNVALFRESGSPKTIGPATLALGPPDAGGHRFLQVDALGFLAIRSNGVAAQLYLGLKGQLPLDLASISGEAVLVVNTTGSAVSFNVPGGASDPNNPTSTFIIPAAAPANPSTFLAVNRDRDGNGVPITPGYGKPAANDPNWNTLKTGAANWAPGAAGAYGVVFIKGGVKLLGILELDVAGYVLLSKSVVSMQVMYYAGRDFLNLASASVGGSLFFSSQGEFDFEAFGLVQLGSDCFNIHGKAYVHVAYLDSDGKGSVGNGSPKLTIDGSLSVGATGFCIDIGDLTLGVHYSEPDITVSITVPVPDIAWSDPDPVFGTSWPYPTIVNKSYSFTVGQLTVNPVKPPPIVLASATTGATFAGGVLRLNVGPNAGARNYKLEELNEVVDLDRVGPGSLSGDKIRVTMFGVSQEYDNVTSISADMGDGNDYLEVVSGVTVPVTVHFGEGDDILDNESAAFVTAYGDPGRDRLTGGSGTDWLYGGDGNDTIDGGAGNDWIEGGNDADRLIGSDGSDTILGGGGGDLIAGDLATISGDASSSVFETTAPTVGGDDILQGGDGADIIFGGSGRDTISGNIGADSLSGGFGKVAIQPGSLAITLLNLGGDGDDLFIWTVGDGNDAIDGRLGSDTLDIIGTDGSAELATVSAKSAGFTVAVGAETVSIDNVEIANIEGRAGSDSFTINDLAAPVQINLKLGSDSVQDAVIVNGSSSDDVFTVSTSGNILRVQKTGGVTIDIFDTSATSGGDTITLNGDLGADTINVRGTLAGTSTTVNGGGDGDLINVGSNASAGSNSNGNLHGIAGDLIVAGGDGADILSLDDTGDSVGHGDGQLTATTITGMGMADGITYAGIETLNVALGTGPDTFNVRATSALTLTTVNTGTGTAANTVNVGSLAPAVAGNVNAIAGKLIVNGQSTTDVLNVDDTGDTIGNTGTLTSTHLTGLGMAADDASKGIEYSGVEALNINLGTGNDTFNVISTLVLTTINTGPGTTNNTVNVGSTAPAVGGVVDLIKGTLTLVGNGSDTLNVDDTGSAGQKEGTLTPTALTGLNMGASGITYSGLSALNVHLGSGGSTLSGPVGNTFTIADINPLTHVSVDGGTSNNDTAIVTFSGDFNGQLDLTAFEHGTVTVNGDFNGILNDTAPGVLELLTVDGAITPAAVITIGSLQSLIIGPSFLSVGHNLAGTLTVTDNLGNVEVAGGMPGWIKAGHIGTIAAYGGFGPVVLRVTENAIERRIEMAAPGTPYPLPNPAAVAGSPYVNVQFFYEGTLGGLANPQLTARLTNNVGASPYQYDLSLVTYSDVAKFNLTRLDAAGVSGLRNVAVEGDLLTAVTGQAAAFFAGDTNPAGMHLPQDDLAGVGVRDFIPNASIQARSIQAIAFGSYAKKNGKIKIGTDASAKDAKRMLVAGTKIVQASETYRVPFSPDATQQVQLFFATSPKGKRFDNRGVVLAVQSVTGPNADGTADVVTPSNVARGAVTGLVKLVPTYNKNNRPRGSAIESIDLRGDGGSFRTKASLAANFSITSTGPLGDVTLKKGSQGLYNLTAPSIFGSITIGGVISGVVQTTGQRADPITSVVSTVSADFGRLYVTTSRQQPVVTSTTVRSKGITGSLVSRDDLISQVIGKGKGITGVVAIQGNLGSLFTPSGQTTSQRLGGLQSTGLFRGELVVLGQVLADMNLNRGLKGGRIAVKGGIIGNLTVKGLDSTSAIVSGGEIGDSALGTLFTVKGKNKGSLAAKGTMNFGKNPPEGLVSSNTTGANTSPIDAIFMNQGQPLAFDLNSLDLGGLDLILQTLSNFSLK